MNTTEQSRINVSLSSPDNERRQLEWHHYMAISIPLCVYCLARRAIVHIVFSFIHKIWTGP